jgi:hypothetical protein
MSWALTVHVFYGYAPDFPAEKSFCTKPLVKDDKDQRAQKKIRSAEKDNNVTGKEQLRL